MTLDNSKMRYALYLKQGRVKEAEDMRQNVLKYRNGLDLATKPKQETTLKPPKNSKK